MLTLDLTVPVTEKRPLESLAAHKLGVERVDALLILKKSVDARKKNAVVYRYRVAASVPDEKKFYRDHAPYEPTARDLEALMAGKKPPTHPLVVGTGPAGAVQ